MKVGDLNITIGADPEVFVTKEGRLVSAHGLVEGTKEQPKAVKDGAVQVDGMALEFNINPADSLESFINNLDSVMHQLSELVPEYDLHADPVAEFGKAIMEETPEEAKELGCEPDFNAWDDGKVNPRPNADVDFRTGAGHVHIGWTEGMDINDPSHIKACIALVQKLDLYLGTPSLLLDDCTKRRKLYGQAGAFRVKPYGVEYRVLSNFWLKTPEYKAWVYNNTIKAIESLLMRPEKDYYDPRVTINTSDVRMARSIVNYFSIPMPEKPPAEKVEEATGYKKNRIKNQHPFKKFIGGDNVQRT